MSSSQDRTSRPPLKPTLASTRTTRTPLTPRVAGNTTSTPTTRPSLPRLPTNTRTPITPRANPREDTSNNGNVTPRSSARRSPIGIIQTSPMQDDPPGDTRSKSTLGVGDGPTGLKSTGSGLGVGMSNRTCSTERTRNPKSMVGDSRAKSPALVRSPGYADLSQTAAAKDNIEARFFHASDAHKKEPAPKKPEPKKTPSFFYADGQEGRHRLSPKPSAASSVLSAVSDKRLSGSWKKADRSKSPPMLSPSLASATCASPYFNAALTPHAQLRSPSPSKEHIHLSYRKGASQIFGTRHTPSPKPAAPQSNINGEGLGRPSPGPLHRKSTSMSSIDSSQSQRSRRRSGTEADHTPAQSPLTNELKSISMQPLISPAADLPSIDTSLASSAISGSPPHGLLSPTKNASELAADARRERKVLDLEISNSSLLAINTSLERELRRQRQELKMFRRMSRAGRFSSAPSDPRLSNSSSALGEEDDEDGYGPATGLTDFQDDLSDSDGEDSLLSGSGEALSPGAQNYKEQDRLAKDEKRLRLDLERHKELLVQSQSMNQSLKRCMYATEEMIREGRKALEYHVRVSDVKLGGRILTVHDDEEIEVDDDAGLTDIDSARGLFDIWRGVGRVEGSERSLDRDSGIEVDQPLSHVSRLTSNTADISHDSEPGLIYRSHITQPFLDVAAAKTTPA